MTRLHAVQRPVERSDASGHHLDRDVDRLLTVGIERLEFKTGHVAAICGLGAW
jgi:hypothetical protein